MAGHWYDKEGKPIHTIVGANGKERDTNLRDAKKLHLLTSPSTVTGQLDKPFLTKWKLDQLYESVYNNPRKLDDNFETYKERVFKEYKNHIESFSKTGTKIHALLEEAYTQGHVEPGHEDTILPVMGLMDITFGEMTDIEPEKTFACADGYGGCIDLVFMSGGKKVIVDFKTKQGKVLDKSKLYPDYAMQLAAYRHAIAPNARCYNMLVSATHPGEIAIHEWSDEDLNIALKKFQCLLQFWKLNNGYDSSF